jgi:hypothetical protein
MAILHCNAGLASIQTAIASAAVRDTILVDQAPQTATWTGQLNITKGINLIGSGIGVTVITGNYTNTGTSPSLIQYEPTDYAANDPFRLSGFTIDAANKTGCLTLTNDHVTPITNVRIDHNRFLRGWGLYVHTEGTVWGVADHNTISWAVGTASSDCIDALGLSNYGSGSWQSLTFALGSQNNFYWEDNTINWNGTGSGGSGDVFDCSWGGRLVSRFNTINDISTGATSNLYPVFQCHGNQYAAEFGSMGYEVYRNTIVTTQTTNQIFGLRGGRCVVFDNTASGGAWTSNQVAEDNISGDLKGNDYATAYPHNLIDDTPQHLHNTYLWNNRFGSTQLGTNIDTTIDYTSIAPAPYAVDRRPIPQVNVDFWTHSVLTGSPQTVGVRVGTLANRPAVGTEGVGYWATDQGSWNTGGAGGQGVLYRWNAGAWQLYYTPYTYPHPLVSGAATPPSGTPVLSVR